jgi:hypothetical protein
MWLLVFVACPLVVLGRDFGGKYGLQGGIGYGKFFDDEGSLGSGLTYRAGAEWRPFRKAGFEGELLGIQYARGDAFHVDGNAQFCFGNAIWYFSRSRFQPYLRTGIGAFKTGYTYSWPISMSPVYRVSKSGAAFNFGTGIRIFLNRHWSLNPDFRLIEARANYTMVSYVSMTAGYHW